MDWEEIDQYNFRAKVFGGWIVKTYEDVQHKTEYNGFQSGWDWRVSTTFVPDQFYEWEIK